MLDIMEFKKGKEERFRKVCDHYKFIQKHNQNKLDWKDKLLADLADRKKNNWDLPTYPGNIKKIDSQIEISPNITISVLEFDEFIEYIKNYKEDEE